MAMFLFMEVWRQCSEELGIDKVVRDLTQRGKPTSWVTRTVDPENPGAVFEKMGKPHYPSACPCYEGYWLLGGTGSVQCRAAGELLPGIVWYGVCSKGHEGCPFYRKEHGNETGKQG